MWGSIQLREEYRCSRNYTTDIHMTPLIQQFIKLNCILIPLEPCIGSSDQGDDRTCSRSQTLWSDLIGYSLKSMISEYFISIPL